jgi:hypothetical protein
MDYKALYEEEVEKRKQDEKRAHKEAEKRKKVESEFEAYRYAKFMRERDLLRKCTMRCRYTEYNFIPRPC